MATERPEHLGHDQIEALYREVKGISERDVPAGLYPSHGIRAALDVLELVTGRVPRICVSTSMKGDAQIAWFHDFDDTIAKRHAVTATADGLETAIGRPRMAGLIRG